MTISDKYMFIGPVFNDVTTVGFTHPVVKDRLVEVQLDHVGIAGEVGNCRLLLPAVTTGQWSWSRTGSWRCRWITSALQSRWAL